mgnify:CR=1 FL=1
MVMFPKVPDVAGVPRVARNSSNSLAAGVGSIVGVIGSLTGGFDFIDQDGPGVASIVDAPVWGLFNEAGSRVINPDSFLGVEALKEYRISDYPIEEGGFGSYNKVELPFAGKITFAKGGTEGARAQFLQEVDEVIASLELLTLVTPEKNYVSLNITHYDTRRTATNGATMITIELWAEEVRNTVTASFSNTQQPESADAVNNGGVQPRTPSPAVQAAIAAEREIT